MGKEGRGIESNRAFCDQIVPLAFDYVLVGATRGSKRGEANARAK